MRTGFALMLLFGGGVLIYAAFQTPPDPRLVFQNILAGRPLGTGFADSMTGAGVPFNREEWEKRLKEIEAETPEVNPGTGGRKK